MKNYFLAEISPEIKEALGALKEKGINFYPMEIDGEKGIVVDQITAEKLTKALKGALKAVDAEMDLEIEFLDATSYEGIEKVRIFKRSNANVTIRGWEGKQQEKFKKITEEMLLPVVKRNICLHVPHKDRVDPKKDGDFHVFIWSSPVRSQERNPPKTIWGYKVDCRDESFSSSGQGFAIYDGDYAVAEIIGNNLYIHHDLCHEGTINELKIYRCLLEKVIAELTLFPKEKKERDKNLAKKRREQNRKRYIEACGQRTKKTLDSLRKDVVDAKSNIEKYQKSLIQEICRLQENKSRLSYLESDGKSELEKYGLEFDKLISLPKVIDVNVTDKSIQVLTDILYCADPRTGKVHEIGEFRIEIYPAGKIRWFNLTRRIDGNKSDMHAPHVFPDGKACLGNAEEVLPELIANYEFSVVAMLAIQFIESVNVDDDAGKHINKWPEAAKKT